MGKIPFNTTKKKTINLIVIVQTPDELSASIENDILKIEQEIEQVCEKIIEGNPDIFIGNGMLLKGSDYRRVHALSRQENVMDSSIREDVIQLDITNPQKNEKDMPKIAIPTIQGFDFLLREDILYCEADKRYTNIHLVGGKKVVATQNLKEFEKRLKESNFFRIHHSYIINLEKIEKYVKGEGGYVIMQNDKNIDVSRRKKAAFLKLWND